MSSLLNSKNIEYGTVIGDWTVLDRMAYLNSTDKHSIYAVKCNKCGWQTLYRGDFLVKQKTPKCKVCARKEKQVVPGTKFGKLRVSRIIQDGPNLRDTIVECLCDCGKVCNVKAEYLLYGTTKSCGCSRSLPGNKNPNYKHGCWSKTTKDPLYSHYKAMKERCYNKNYHHYFRYGGREIFVCQEWLDDFLAFKEWALKNGYKKGLSLDRINNDEGYNPKNCRWVNQKTQVRNSSKVVRDNYGVPLVIYLEKRDKEHLLKFALKLWRTIVKNRAHGLCELCGKPGTDAHHWFFTRAQSKLASVMPVNGVFLCRNCHNLAHSNIAEIKEKIKPLRKFNNLSERNLLNARQTNATADNLFNLIQKIKNNYKEYL